MKVQKGGQMLQLTSCVCPVINHEFRNNIVKESMDQQTTDARKTDCQFVFCNNKKADIINSCVFPLFVSEN